MSSSFQSQIIRAVALASLELSSYEPCTSKKPSSHPGSQAGVQGACGLLPLHRPSSCSRPRHGRRCLYQNITKGPELSPNP